MYISLCLLIGSLAAGIWYGLSHRAGYLSAPFLICAIYLVWFLPQLISLTNDNSIAEMDLVRVAVMSALCLGAVQLGWVSKRPEIVKPTSLESARTLLPACVLLTALGTSINYLISAMPEETRSAAQWTGPITILAFFSLATTVALALAMLLALRLKSKSAYLMLACNIGLLLPLVLYFARRANAGYIVMVPIACMWFVRRVQLSRVRGDFGLFCSALFINSAQDLRSSSYYVDASGRIVMRDRSISQLLQLNWFAGLSFSSPERALEVRNARDIWPRFPK